MLRLGRSFPTWERAPTFPTGATEAVFRLFVLWSVSAEHTLGGLLDFLLCSVLPSLDGFCFPDKKRLLCCLLFRIFKNVSTDGVPLSIPLGQDVN